jgi:hypothetical protein
VVLLCFPVDNSKHQQSGRPTAEKPGQLSVDVAEEKPALSEGPKFQNEILLQGRTKTENEEAAL